MDLYLQESHMKKPSPCLAYLQVYNAEDATTAHSALCEFSRILEQQHIKVEPYQGQYTLLCPSQMAHYGACNQWDEIVTDLPQSCLLCSKLSYLKNQN